MFGCSSSCVAHPNQTSLMKRPPTQYVAEAIGHSQRVVVLPAGRWAITPKPRDMARSRPNPRRSGRPLGPVDAAGIGDASQGGLQRADAAALRGPAQRSQPVAAEAQWTHPGGEGRGLATIGGAGCSPAVPRIHGRAPQLTVGVPADRGVGEVGPADRDRPGGPHLLHTGGIQGRVGVRERLQSLRRRVPARSMFPFDRERDAVQRRQFVAAGGCTVGQPSPRPGPARPRPP
jgi:hypothetical protein